MTSLRTFQNQIEEIHLKETVKQRAQAAADKEKENKAPQSKNKGKDGSDIPEQFIQVEESRSPEVEEKIQVRILVSNCRNLDFELHARHYYFPEQISIANKLGT